jgi:S-adenosylmethionine:tRNA ribosyltransferase-isomerase
MELNLNDFNYNLPADKIALFPAEKRDQSKLLVYNGGNIQHKVFKDIVEILPSDALLVFNNSKVVPARINFVKDTGAVIEVFILGPESDSGNFQTYFNSPASVRCSCTIGNKKRWPKASRLKKTMGGNELSAVLVDDDASIVELSWNSNKHWSEILHLFGEVPLPPYINRSTTESDTIRYQTVYSEIPGAVAAPTAGLHFTEEIIEQIKNKGISMDYLTLHVGAGTFLPIKAESVENHKMHSERLVFSMANIDALLKGHRRIIPVGTTSCRSLESLYWFGVQLIRKQGFTFEINQNYPYENVTGLPGRAESLVAIKDFMTKQDLSEIHGHTSIFVYPSYQFRMTDALITNFHQPGSTLILLVAALIGENWKTVYNAALQNDYRFLSYGDSSFLTRGN